MHLVTSTWASQVCHKKQQPCTLNNKIQCLNIVIAAENVAVEWEVTRKEQDEFAAKSQNKCQVAQEAGHFDEEIVSIKVKNRKGLFLHLTEN